MAAGNSQRGFSLLELMIVVLVLTVIMGVVFTTINHVQFRAANEQVKLDQFQETREFMDQMTRDLHQAGYPNFRMFGPTVLPHTASSPLGQDDTRNAIGLVKVDVGDLWFEGDVDADGYVDSVRFHLELTGANCPCLRRSADHKYPGGPMNQPIPTYYTEVQNVLNGTTAAPIFTALAPDGTQISLPVDYSSNPNALADIRTIRVSIQVRAPSPDPQTGLRPETNLGAVIRLTNCSGATSGSMMSCL